MTKNGNLHVKQKYEYETKCHQQLNVYKRQQYLLIYLIVTTVF